MAVHDQIRLKEGETFLLLTPQGVAEGERSGLFRRDTRYLKRYAFRLEGAVLLQSEPSGDSLVQRFALVDRHREQAVGLHRTLRLRPDGLDDEWEISNTSQEPQVATIELDAEADFVDLFQMGRGEAQTEVVTDEVEAGVRRFRYFAADGIRAEALLEFTTQGSPPWRLTLAPGERATIRVQINLKADDDDAEVVALPTREAWRASFADVTAPPGRERALRQAVDDLRTLLLATPHGLYPAAGLPWFVNCFGRDALIVGIMLASVRTDILAGVLRFLAAHQAQEADPFREAEPGKILHEIRRGEWSRTGRLPFGRYYGSVDATPLFVVANEEYLRRSGDVALVRALAPQWRAALSWLVGKQDREGGLLTFKPSGSGLAVQSWKDSPTSMNHADGAAAPPPLAVAEVQGYAFAAFNAAAVLEGALGEAQAADTWRERAAAVQRAIGETFWLDDLNTYAMAVDGEGRPLRVLSSDPGHLLWSGVVPIDKAQRLVRTLLSEPLWSGWGLRTLGACERRYNPVSYHNGSVWPHDTALFAAGLARYGFVTEFHTVRDALFDLAMAMPRTTLPELVSGYPRYADEGPIHYTHACAPQAWAAAALPYLAALDVS